MRAHIEGDIYIIGALGYDIAKRVMRDVKDPRTKIVENKEVFEVEKHYVTLSGAINGLLHHKISSLSNDKELELNELAALIKDHKEFIEKQLGGIKA